MNAVTEPTTSDPVSPLVGLGEMDIRVLSYSSAMGKEFDFEVLQKVSEMEEERLAEVLEGLVHRGMLRELKGGDSYEFAREDTQGQVYRTISSSRVRLIHKKIAEALERVYAGNPPPEAIAEMGRHYHLGRLTGKSVMYNRYAATLARESFSPETAVRYLERVAEDYLGMQGDHGSEQSDVYRDLGDLHMGMGAAGHADELYVRSLEVLPQKEVALQGLLLLSRAEANRVLDKLAVTNQCCAEAIALLQSIHHRRGLAMAHRLLSRSAFKAEDYERGRKEAEDALSLLSTEQDPKEIARCYIDLGNAFSTRNDKEGQEQCTTSYRKAIEILSQVHDHRELARAHNNLAVSLGMGDPKGALAELDQARINAENGHDMNSVGWSLLNSVEFLLALGKEPEATAANESAFMILSRMDDNMAMQQISMNRGVLAHYRKAYEEAERHFDDAQRRADEMGYPSVRVEMLLRRAALFYAWGKRDRCVRTLAEIDQLGLENLLPHVMPMYDDLKKNLGEPPGRTE